MKFVFDIDGTISFNGQEIEKPIVRAINSISNNGKNVIFASARPIRDLLPLVRDFQNSTLIGGNGSIVSVQGKIETMEQIVSTDFQLIKDLIAANNLDYIVDDTWNYSARVSPKNKILKQLDPEHAAENISIEEINKPIKIILLNLKPTLFDSLYKMLKNNTSLAIIRHQGENNLDLTATRINKYTTLRRLLPKKEYIAFGNDANDTILLNHAYKSVWVGQLDGANKSGVFQPNFICSPNANSLVSIINRVGSLSEEQASEK